jgi:preprotein translocase subunit SecD
VKQRAAIGWLVTSVALTTLVLVLTVTSGNVPLLGLDLQGGVSVVLEPTGDVEADRLEQAKDIVTRRVDGLGVAEPEISIQGDNILVQIPGIDDPDRALELVGQTAELRFRPVLRQEAMPAGLEDLEVPTTLDPDATALPTDTTVADGATTVPGSDTTL